MIKQWSKHYTLIFQYKKCIFSNTKSTEKLIVHSHTVITLIFRSGEGQKMMKQMYILIMCPYVLQFTENHEK